MLFVLWLVEMRELCAVGRPLLMRLCLSVIRGKRHKEHGGFERPQDSWWERKVAYPVGEVDDNNKHIFADRLANLETEGQRTTIDGPMILRSGTPYGGCWRGTKHEMEGVVVDL